MDIREKQSSGKRLIDANKLIKNGLRVNYGFDDNGVLLIPIGDVIRSIKRAKTVDAVPVVRCRECKYHEEEGIEMVYCPNMIGGWVENEWFCADGKRKEGAD